MILFQVKIIFHYEKYYVDDFESHRIPKHRFIEFTFIAHKQKPHTFPTE